MSQNVITVTLQEVLAQAYGSDDSRRSSGRDEPTLEMTMDELQEIARRGRPSVGKEER